MKEKKLRKSNFFLINKEDIYSFGDISAVVDVYKLEHLFNIHLRKATTSLLFIVGLPATLRQALNNILQVTWDYFSSYFFKILPWTF